MVEDEMIGIELLFLCYYSWYFEDVDGGSTADGVGMLIFGFEVDGDLLCLHGVDLNIL